jgi:tetratricopeptide (TPR) repeat protein
MIEATSTTMSNLQSILDLNNHAVTYLCQGNHSATTSTLREAIRGLEKCFLEAKEATASSSSQEPPRKRRRQDLGQAVDTTTTASSSSKVSSTDGYVPFRIITVSDSVLASPPTTSALEDTTALLNIYDRAFDFPSIKKDEEDCDMDYFSSQQSKTRLAAILLYNLGLAYHRQGICDGNSKDLKAALKLYLEAYMVLKTAWANREFEELFVLLLALINKMS